ncbi:PREDICTED: uncharacterized protein LOC104605824 isoform X2 [Nelumbo nucifera]|uniref:Uncharacterized protein LOC104605824 isoform X2 n=1 Tax=Nelumbo nucifera TaxID=4432 RepID=A0A1U8ARR1_NELNU|nr:PREDICTED: uncharacterized protein LOC104605824 isoform X2 [Nelumbo nucifera]
MEVPHREVELPECPVCLQIYNSGGTIPRVLSCGHSACEACLGQLSQRFPNTIRCPACTQLVKFPEAQGPSALPKNIDLLSFIDQQNPDPNSSQSHRKTQDNPNRGSAREFLPRLPWSEEFYSTWKDWVLPFDAVSVEDRGEEGDEAPCCSLLQGRIASSSSSSSSPLRYCFLRQNQNVSLFRVAFSSSSASEFSFSYTARIMIALNNLKDGERTELGLILRTSLRQFRVCRVYGLWMDSKTGSVSLVCERLNGDFWNKLDGLRHGLVVEDCGDPDKEEQGFRTDAELSGFLMIGMDLCEAVMALHSEGLVNGCLAPSCFSFDDLGRIYVDLNEILVMGRRMWKCIANFASGRQVTNNLETEDRFTNLSKVQEFVSPELLLEFLQGRCMDADCESLGYSVGYGSDSWSLACILVRFLVGGKLTEKLFKDFYNLFQTGREKISTEYLDMYEGWTEKVGSVLETYLGTKFASLQKILCRCFAFDPGSRPHVTDVWRCIRELLVAPNIDMLVSLEVAIVKEEYTVHCLILGDLCHLFPETVKGSENQSRNDLQGSDDSSGTDANKIRDGRINEDLVEDLLMGTLKSINLKGHLDCISRLVIGGGFLFSSSYDKTLHVWSLQDFTYVQSFRGHEHRIMAVVFVDAGKQLCISGDIGGGIFIWDIGSSLEQEPLKKWYEQKDWRYSGIHSLAISGTEHLYTGSGDRSIKAWSLKMWRNDVLERSIQIENGAILAIELEGQLLFAGGWNKTVYVQEISGDELQIDTQKIGSIACSSVITALLYWQGKLFVGFADGTIKVYCHGL